MRPVVFLTVFFPILLMGSIESGFHKKSSHPYFENPYKKASKSYSLFTNLSKIISTTNINYIQPLKYLGYNH
jgi:methionyl-tRNA synthetase